MNHSRRRIVIIASVIIFLVVCYELAFRFCTATWGEVNVESNPPKVYYSLDADFPLPLCRVFFGFRTKLPFGKVKLSEGTGAYVDGGRIYRLMPDGSWRDMTDKMIDYQKQKSK